MNEFLSYHFYIYFKIEGYVLLCYQRSVLGRSRVYPDVIKIFTPTPYSLQGVRLAPFLTRRYAGYRLVPAYPLWEPLGDASAVSALGSPPPSFFTTSI